MTLGRFRGAAVLLAVGASLFAAATAYTVPRYSARYGQDCNLCHVNPTGGGQRSTYATQFIVPKEMALLALDEKTLAAIDPQLSQTVTIGADLRTMFFKSDLSEQDLETLQAVRPQRLPPTENFFEMQGNVYLTLQLTDRFFAHVARGISTSSELYGLGYILPANGYVKVGRFAPDFGWRVSDHTAFVRDRMGFFPPGHTDVGIEVGVYPGHLALTASLGNGHLGDIQDSDKNLAVTGRALYRMEVGEIGIGLGGSVWSNDGFDAAAGISGKRLVGGPLGYVHWRPVTWIWEADVSEFDAGQVDPPQAFFTSQELTVQLRQGLDLKGTFDLYDENRDQDTGKQVRYGFGAESMLYPFVRLEAMMWVYKSLDENGVPFPEPEYNQFVAQVHFCY